jgi:hypothetical protein
MSKKETKFAERDKNDPQRSHFHLFIILGLLLISMFLLRLVIGGVEDEHRSNLIDAAKSFMDGVLITITLAITFSIFDRIGLILPIQRDLKATLTEAQTLWTKQRKLMEAAEIYHNARAIYGLFDVAGLQKDGPDNIHGTKLIRRVILEAKPGNIVRCMNTYYDRSESLYEAIHKALKAGVNIQILILHPDQRALLAMRYDDAYKEQESEREFFENIRMGAEWFVGIQERTSGNSLYKGTFEVRFYRNSFNYPLLAVSEPTEGGQSPEDDKPIVIYTGYYGSKSSEVMPYVEWRGGEFNPYGNFIEIFTKKWLAKSTRPNLKMND